MGFVFREDPIPDDYDRAVDMAAITALRDDRKKLFEFVSKLDKRKKVSWYNKKYGDPVKWYEQNKLPLTAIKARELN